MKDSFKGITHNIFFQLQLIDLRTTNYELDGKCKKLERGMNTCIFRTKILKKV